MCSWTENCSTPTWPTGLLKAFLPYQALSTSGAPHPGTQACRGQFVGAQDCPSLALPSKEHPSLLERGCVTSSCHNSDGLAYEACCELSHQDWWERGSQTLGKLRPGT